MLLPFLSRMACTNMQMPCLWLVTTLHSKDLLPSRSSFKEQGYLLQHSVITKALLS